MSRGCSPASAKPTFSSASRAVLTLLQDEEWGRWSDNQIAKKAGVSQPFVSALRGSLITDISEPRTYTTKHGTQAVMSVANIGRPIAPVVVEVRASSEPVPLPHGGGGEVISLGRRDLTTGRQIAR